MLSSSDRLVTIVQVTSVGLSLALAIDSWTRFVRFKERALLLPWLAYWTAYLVVAVFNTWFWQPSGYGYWVSEAVWAVCPWMLFVCADLLDTRRLPHSAIPKRKLALIWLRWSPVAVLDIACTAGTDQTAPALLGAAIESLGVALIAGRLEQYLLRWRPGLVLMLYTYAILNLVFFAYQQGGGHPSQEVYAIRTVLVTMLRLVLYVAGIAALVAARRQQVSSERRAPIYAATGTERSRDKSWLPKPDVKIQLDGVWGIVYVLWGAPSGKAVFMTAGLAIVGLVIFCIENLQQIIAAVLHAAQS